MLISPPVSQDGQDVTGGGTWGISFMSWSDIIPSDEACDERQADRQAVAVFVVVSVQDRSEPSGERGLALSLLLFLLLLLT